MKKCKNCGGKVLSDESKFCPNCGAKMVEEKANTAKDEESFEKLTKRKYTGGDIARYVIGSLFILAGISNIIQENYYGFLDIAVGISIYPGWYRSFVNKFIKSRGWLIALQIVLPICLFLLDVSFYEGNKPYYSSENNGTTTIFKRETPEEKALNTVKSKLYSSYQTISSSEINADTGNYDFEIVESKSDLTAYTCASDMISLVKQVAGLEKVGNIQFECKSEDKTIYYVSIENVNSLSLSNIEGNIKYFDANHNPVATNLDTLKANVVNDYKKSCNSYKYKDVLRDPATYSGKKAHWFGEIIQVVDKSSYSSTFRVDVTCEKYSFSKDYYCDDTIYLTYYGDGRYVGDNGRYRNLHNSSGRKCNYPKI